MKIEDFEIGEIYCRENESNIYKCVEKTDDWILMIEYSFNHYVATCEFWDQNYLDESFNQTLRLEDEGMREYDESIFREHLERRENCNDTLYYKD